MENNVHVCTDLSGGVRVPSPRTRPLEKIKFNMQCSKLSNSHTKNCLYFKHNSTDHIWSFSSDFFLRRFSMRLILNYNCVQEFKIEELYNLKST